MDIYYSNGTFSCLDVTESAIDDLRHGNGPMMQIICDTPFKGLQETLAELAIKYLNGKYQTQRCFNGIYGSRTETDFKNQSITHRIVFQMK